MSSRSQPFSVTRVAGRSLARPGPLRPDHLTLRPDHIGAASYRLRRDDAAHSDAWLELTLSRSLPLERPDPGQEVPSW